jgi:hypothetical protein
MRPRRSVVFLCIAAIALAAFLPGAPALECSCVEPAWVLLPDLSSLFIPDAAAPADEQPQSLLSLLPSRAPPHISLG